MGVLYDYYRAPDASAAIRALERDGGPKGRGGPGQPVFDAVDAKGVDPVVMLTQLVDVIRGEHTDFSSVDALDYVPVWPPPEVPQDGDSGPWVDELGNRMRDALAGIEDARLPEISSQWSTVAGLEDHDPDGLRELVGEFVALARRARDADEHLYCWSSL